MKREQLDGRAIAAARERPILFSAPMVRAILAGCKTMTRRVVKQQPPPCEGFPRFCNREWGIYLNRPHAGPYKHLGACPYGEVGDRLWVRETWTELLHTSPASDAPLLCDGDKLIEHATFYFDCEGNKRWHYDGKVIAYRATSDVEFCDGDGFSGEFADKSDMPRWRPSIHMPRWASRLTLEVTDVRVERLQEITEEDAQAEGSNIVSYRDGRGEESARFGFRELWDKLNGPRGYGWESNPWVWVVSFKRLEPNKC